MKDYRLYILMRTDLASMSRGRACAQASHAANAFIKKWGHREEVQEWEKQTKQGFGTAIILNGGCGYNIHKLVRDVQKKKFAADWVVDPEYGIQVSTEIYGLLDSDKYWCKPDNNTPIDGKISIFRKVETCAYIFGDKEDLFPIVGELPLY